MHRNGKNRIGNPRIPRNAWVAGDVGSAVDVPEAPEVLVVAGILSPRRVGDHVAVLSHEGLNDPEDLRVADGPLDRAAPIEHLVTKRGGFPGRISPHIGRIFVKDSFDVGAERGELPLREDAGDEDISLRLKALDRSGRRAGAEREISGGSG